METLDLHGVRYHQVDLMVENFILLNEPPIRIVTGNSPAMHLIVKEIVARHEMHWMYENFWNLGAVVITETLL